MMKREKLLSGLISVLLSACIAFGGICCMVTAFDFPTEGLGVIAVFSLLFAAMITYWMLGGRNPMLLFAAVLVVVLGLFCSVGKMILGSLEAILYQVTLLYDSAYGTGVVGTPHSVRGVSLVPGLCTIAAIVTLVQVWTVSRRHNAILAVLYGLLPLFTCMVVTDTVPDSWALFLLLAGLALLILTNTVRRRDAAAGNRLTAMLLIPSILMTALLFWAVPRENYKAQQGQLQQSLSEWFWELPFMPELSGQSSGGISTGVVRGTEVDLSTMGPNNQMTYVVMEVNAPTTGTLYLRAQAYDIYTGKQWQLSKGAAEDRKGWPSVGMRELGTISIHTRIGQSMRYFPYYVSGSQWLEDYNNGLLENPDWSREYSFHQMTCDSDYPLHSDDEMDPQMRYYYLQLPDETELAASRLLQIAGISSAHEVASFVSQSASYDQQTDAMPKEETDFALWFLEKGETGYCVHFATAATVLLRAAGIPARYVTGYLTWAKAGEDSPVTANQAHAWVEYYDEEEGWKILEATPGEGQPQPPAEIPSETTRPDAPTQPTETEPESQPDQPTRPQESKPKDPTEPGGTDEPKTDLTWLLQILKVIGWIGGPLAALWLQMILRRRWRYKRMYTGTANKKALARWREVLRFCRILKEQPPEELEELAEKAKFSQHKLTPEELKIFDRWLRLANGRLKEKKLSLLIRLVWAV